MELNNGLLGARAGHPLLAQLATSVTPFDATGAASEEGAFADLCSSAAGGDHTGVLALVAQLAGGGGPTTTQQPTRGTRASAATDATPMGTIERSGPGFFTRTVMAWLVDADRDRSGPTGPTAAPSPSPSAPSATCAVHAAAVAARPGEGGQEGQKRVTPGDVNVDDGGDDDDDNDVDRAMVFPCGYFYPLANVRAPAVPPNAKEEASTKGIAAGDTAAGDSAPVLELGRSCRRPETFAVHFWSCSWQEEEEEKADESLLGRAPLC